MRESIPNAKVVETTFRTLAKRFESVQRKINAQAARCMRDSQYDAVERWMDIGKSVADYAGRVDAFAKEWKRLVKATRIVARGKTRPPTTVTAVPSSKKAMPASRFYEPAMKALANRGGQAKLQDSPFEVIDFSLKEAAPEKTWLEKALAAIARCEVFIVMLREGKGDRHILP